MAFKKRPMFVVRGENLGWDMLRFQALNQHLDLTNKHVFFQTQLPSGNLT
jgi:hypothetical protein